MWGERDMSDVWELVKSGVNVIVSDNINSGVDGEGDSELDTEVGAEGLRDAKEGSAVALEIGDTAEAVADIDIEREFTAVFLDVVDGNVVCE